MTYYEEWVENTKKYKKQTEKLKELAKEQKACLDNHDIEGLLKCLDKKQKILNKIEKINDVILDIRESVQDDEFSEDEFGEIEKLQQQAADDIEAALKEMSQQEKQLSTMKAEVGKRIQETKRQKSAAQAYSGEGINKRMDGMFFDKRN